MLDAVEVALNLRNSGASSERIDVADQETGYASRALSRRFAGVGFRVRGLESSRTGGATA